MGEYAADAVSRKEKREMGKLGCGKERQEEPEPGPGLHLWDDPLAAAQDLG